MWIALHRHKLSVGMIFGYLVYVCSVPVFQTKCEVGFTVAPVPERSVTQQ